ncbi:MAG: terminase small subunit [Oscillospiraceae bacterium]|nr:terminase small subunit [Oscillospiraceae bacterium]
MTAKEKRFCEEYLIDLNATQAAIRAGYSAKSAKSIGCENLTKPDLCARIEKLKAERSRRTGITADRVLEELAKISFVKATDVIDGGTGEIKEDAAPEDLACISSIKVKTIPTEDGLIVEREVKLADKNKSLELLGKHLGLFDKKQDEGETIADDGFIDALNGTASEDWADEE